MAMMNPQEQMETYAREMLTSYWMQQQPQQQQSQQLMPMTYPYSMDGMNIPSSPYLNHHPSYLQPPTSPMLSSMLLTNNYSSPNHPNTMMMNQQLPTPIPSPTENNNNNNKNEQQQSINNNNNNNSNNNNNNNGNEKMKKVQGKSNFWAPRKTPTKKRSWWKKKENDNNDDNDYINTRKNKSKSMIIESNNYNHNNDYDQQIAHTPSPSLQQQHYSLPPTLSTPSPSIQSSPSPPQIQQPQQQSQMQQPQMQQPQMQQPQMQQQQQQTLQTPFSNVPVPSADTGYFVYYAPPKIIQQEVPVPVLPESPKGPKRTLANPREASNDKCLIM
ncbi:unnamed protein product [Cunninghamella blakesleeana]